MTPTDPAAAAFGARLREARTQRGWTQEDLARAAEVKTWTVSRWETGVQMPRGRMLSRVATSLEVSIDWLAGGSEPTAGAPSVDLSSPLLDEVRRIMGATDEELRWLATAPRYHRATVGSLIDALRADRQGMSPEQAQASRDATERHRDPSVRARTPRR